jgi:polyhydroxyalkanoate synthase
LLPGLTDRPDAPGPMRRRGPRPLGLHLALGTPGAITAAPAIPSLNQPGPDAALIAGIAAYRRHPYHRTLPDPPVLWQAGSTRLLDYGAGSSSHAPTVLFVPSLINRAYVLDLAPGRSMLRWLAAQGVRPLLLDWGWPEAVERRFTMSDIVTERLLPAIAAAGEPVVLAGYCMGGLLTVAAAQLDPANIAALALLATPWDFAATLALPRIAALLPHLPGLLAGGTLPIDALQAFFALQEAGAVGAKFRAFAAMDQASPAAAMFVALEDWLADGIPLAAPVALECLSGWYGDNTPARGLWRVADQVIDPAKLRLPTLVVLPSHDRIVPPEAARPLAGLIAGAAVLQPPLGHVGMVAGSRAETLVWPALLDWLRGPGRPMSR